MKKEVHPINKEQFARLKKFAKKILNLCEEVNIEPILYGSFMIFEYTKNKNLEVNDIDFYIKEGDFERLAKILTEKKINFEYPKKWHTLQIIKDDLKIEFDSIDFWNKSKKEFVGINFEGKKIKALSIGSLKAIYKQASETSEDNPKGNLKKYNLLKNIK